jgi:hypothetical protein
MRPQTSAPADPKEPNQITIRTGKLFLVEHGKFIMLTSPVILTNGIVVTLEGLMRMPDGKTRILSEGEYLS